DKETLLATQFRIETVPPVYAIYRGQPVADLTNYYGEAQLKKVLDQLLAQLKIEAEGAVPESEIEPLVAMGEQVLADGDAPRAVSIFRQVREMAPDRAEVIGGPARALIATSCSKLSAATANGTTARRASGSFSCLKRRASKTAGRARSGVGFQRSCSHEPNPARAAVSAARRDPVSALAAALAHLRGALSGNGPRRGRRSR